MQPRVTSWRTRVPRFGMVAALLGALLLAALSAAAVGATNFAITVDHVADDNGPCAASGQTTDHCSLRDAIRFANTKMSADTTTITLPASLSLYQLTQIGLPEDNAALGDLDIKANVTINGGGANTTVIDGFGTSGNPDRVFQIFGGYTVTFNNLTIENGKATTSAGGGLFVAANATVTLTNCIVTGNTTTYAFGGGGGLFISGNTRVTLNGTTVSNNNSTGIQGGGGIYNNGGTLAVNTSVVSGNHAIADGGGIVNNFGGALTATDSMFTSNSVTGTPGLPGADGMSGGFGGTGGAGGDATGGAIAATSSFSVTGSRFTGNTVTGGTGGKGGLSGGSGAGSGGGSGAGSGGNGGAGTGGAIDATASFSVAGSAFTGNTAVGGSGGNGGGGGGGGGSAAEVRPGARSPRRLRSRSRGAPSPGTPPSAAVGASAAAVPHRAAPSRMAAAH